MMKRTITTIFMLTAALCSHTTKAQITIPNAGFENWQMLSTVEVPTGWNVSDAAGLGCAVPTSVKTTDKAEGNFGIMLESAFCVNAGAVHEGFATISINTTNKPDSFKFKFKSLYNGMDSASVKATFYNGTTIVGNGAYYIKTTQNTYKDVSVPITYTGTPTKVVIFLSSDGISMPTSGNRVWVDDLKFANKTANTSTASIAGGVMSSVTCYPVPANDVLHVEMNMTESMGATVTLCDMSGKVISREAIQTHRGKQVHTLNTATLQSGMYLCAVYLDNGEKIINRILK